MEACSVQEYMYNDRAERPPAFFEKLKLLNEAECRGRPDALARGRSRNAIVHQVVHGTEG